jgi:polyphenol oxidase
VPHGFSLRCGGVSGQVSGGMFSSLNFGNPGDLASIERDPVENIRANQRLLMQAIGPDAPDRELVEAWQVHGPDVHVVRSGEAAHPTRAHTGHDTKADALVTDDSSRLIGVRVADCVPVLLATRDGAVVGAVHAGWRGVVAGVLPRAIEVTRRLTEGRGDDRCSIVAAIGPCLSVDALEVGPEVAAEFDRVFGPRALAEKIVLEATTPGKFMIDMPQALVMQMRDAGMHPSAIERWPICTGTCPRTFSHRRERGRTGRMLAVIGARVAKGT